MNRKATTANEPTDKIDPGGTRPAKPPPQAAKADEKPAARQTVKTGDRNAMKGKTP